MHLLLIDTAPCGQRGSMSQYRNVILDALSSSGENTNLEITTLRLALSSRVIAKFPLRVRNWIHHAWIMATAKARIRRCKADIIHILDGSHAYIAKWCSGTPVVVTSHDLIPALQSRGYFGGKLPSRAGQWLIRQSIESLSASDLIIAVSRNTASDIHRFASVANEKIRVVCSAVSKDISERAEDAPLVPWQERRAREDAYMLHLGNNAFYKNRAGVVRVFARVLEKCNIRLIMAGPAPTKELLSIVEEKGLSGAIEFAADPDETALDNLYRNACLFLFPSLYEGFGWPPLEAMAYGCPVVCSDAASLPEVVGDAALTCSFGNEEQFAGQCTSVLQDERIANDLVAKGLIQAGKFTVKKMGKELFSVYDAVLQTRSAGQRIQISDSGVDR